MNVGLLFGIIFTIILLGFVLAFGGKYIMDFLGMSSQASMGQQIITFRKTVDDVFDLSQNSVQEFTFAFYPGVTKVCFVNPADTSSNPQGNWETSEILNVLIMRGKYNLLVFGDNEEYQKIDHLKPMDNFCIFDTRKLLLRNEGFYVSVSLPQI